MFIFTVKKTVVQSYILWLNQEHQLKNVYEYFNYLE